MVQTTSFTILVEGELLSVIAPVLALRTLAFVVLALGAVVAATYLITLALDMLISIGAPLAILYDGSDSTLRLSGRKSAGVLLSFQLSLSCERAESATNRRSSRRRLPWRISALPGSMLFFRSSRLSLPTRAHHQALFRPTMERSKRSGKVGLRLQTRRWLVLRSHDSLFQSSSLSGGKKWKCPTTHHSKQGTLFIPRMNDGGFQAILGVRPLILCMLGYVLVNVFSSFTRSLAASCRK